MGRRKIKNNRRKNVQVHSAGSGLSLLDRILTGGITVFSFLWLFLIQVVMPFYNQEGFVHIGSDKSYLLRTSGMLLGKVLLPVSAVWLVCRVCRIVRERRLSGEKLLQKQDLQIFSAVDVFMILYAVSAVFSYACSEYPETALWGTKGWYMGLLPQLILVVSYFVLSRFEFAGLGRWLLLPCFPVSAVVFVLGYLNRFDIWPLQMESSGLPGYISTIGNINWYCSYVVIILFLAIGLFWQEAAGNRIRSILWILYLGLGFATLITQGSESGIFAMICVLFFLFVRSAFLGDAMRMQRFWQILAVLGGAGAVTWVLCLLFPGRMNYPSALGGIFYGPFSAVLLVMAAGGWFYTKREEPWRLLRLLAKVLGISAGAGLAVFILLIGINTAHPGSIGPLSDLDVFTFGPEWGSRRGATWMLGAGCYAKQDLLHKLTGVGPDCMTDYLYSEAGVAAGLQDMAVKIFADRRLTNAHCELLTILVNMGILGAVAYLGMLVAYLKNGLSGRALEEKRQVFACALGVLALVCNNVWSFQQSIGVSTMFVVIALGSYYDRERAVRTEKAAGKV